MIYRWHPSIPGIMAMSVTQNGSLEEHLDSLSKRLAMPTVLMIWNMSFSYFPQILLRTPDDVKGHEFTLLSYCTSHPYFLS